MQFLNNIAFIAEEEGHHPDICISYNKLDISLFTHAVGGLSENDFIMAAKIDKLNENPDSKQKKY
jgi:4a-hydroxytetrahydrobiopterin dehydratase